MSTVDTFGRKYVIVNPDEPNRAERRQAEREFRQATTPLVAVSLTPKGKRVNASGGQVAREDINYAAWHFTGTDPRPKRRKARNRP